MTSHILIVEDSPTQALALKALLDKAGYQTDTAENGVAALERIRSQAFDLIISDVVMPEMNGYELCRILKGDPELKNIPLVLLTTMTDVEDVIGGLKSRADYYISKPYRERYLIAKVVEILTQHVRKTPLAPEMNIEIVHKGQPHVFRSSSQQIVSLLFSIYDDALQQKRELIKAQESLRQFNEELEGAVKERTAALTQEIAERKRTQAMVNDGYKTLRKALSGTIRATALMVETRDPYTAGHQKRVADLATLIGEELRLSDERIEGIQMAGIIHDVGKIAIPSEILTKPTRLREMEFAMIKTHTDAGYNILKDIDFPWPIAEIILQHHEKLNGSGYPRGLSGEDILAEARIMCVADVVEAIAADRPYRAALGIEAAVDEISKEKGTLFDPEAVEACLRIIRNGGFQIN